MRNQKRKNLQMDLNDLLMETYKLLKENQRGQEKVSGSIQSHTCGRISGH